MSRARDMTVLLVRVDVHKVLNVEAVRIDEVHKGYTAARHCAGIRPSKALNRFATLIASPTFLCARMRPDAGRPSIQRYCPSNTVPCTQNVKTAELECRCQ